MSQGVPVVGTVGEGTADVIVDGEDGFLVRPFGLVRAADSDERPVVLP